MAMKSDSPIIIKNDKGLFQLIDDAHHTLETKTAQRGLAIFAPYFDDPQQQTFKEDLTYVQLLELVKKLNRRLQRKGVPEVQTSNKFDQFVQQRQYYIKEQSQAGLTIKDGDTRWQQEFDSFKKVLVRKLHGHLSLNKKRLASL